MEFYKKLQLLRKEKKLSQEDLAYKLNVSRQAVSKWESGQTYPEMDKLIAISKIFKCTLDDLINEDVKEVLADNKIKNNINYFLDEIASVFKKSIKMFKSMSFKDIVKCLVFMLMVAIIILILSIPVNYIYNLGQNIFINFGSRIGRLLSSVWYFILQITYIIFSFLAYFYIYKVKYLDNFEETETNSVDQKEVTEVNSTYVTQTEEVKKKNNNNKSNKLVITFSFFSKLMLLFVKMITLLTIIPFATIFVVTLIIFAISIGLLFKGVVYFGFIILMIAVLIFSISITKILTYFILNIRIKQKELFYTFVVSIVTLSLGIAVTFFDVVNINYKDEMPPYYTYNEELFNYPMTDDLIIVNNGYNYKYIEYIVDDELVDIKLKIKYLSDFLKIDVNNLNSKISINNYTIDTGINKKIYDTIINDLKSKTFHNYEYLFENELKVYASSANIKKLKENIDDYYHPRRQYNDDCQLEIDNYGDMVREYEGKILMFEQKVEELTNQYENKISELEAKNELLIQEYENKILDYKDKINQILAN